MSGEAENYTEQNREEQFFGISHPVFPEEGEQLEIEIEDEPKQGKPEEQPEPRQKDEEEPPKAAASGEDDDDLTDIESELSDRVKKRIDRLTGRMRRAERDRDEAFNATQTLYTKLNETSELLTRGEQALAEQFKGRAEAQLERAKDKYRTAYESGDTDEIITAQEEMLRASNQVDQANQYLSRKPARAAEQPSAQQAPPQQGQQPRQPAQPDPRAQAWADENPWFGSPKHKAMTALAYGVHEEAIANGIEPNSDEYFEAIDSAVQRAFPDQFGGNAPVETDVDTGGEPRPAQTRRQSPSTPAVAPAGRTGGTRSNRITLTESQKSLARRLGLTTEQYAAQLLKEQKG